MYRLFVAIDLPADIKEELARMFFGIPGARWVPEDQLHLTLRFIGEVEGGVFKDIRETLAAIQAEPFAMRLMGLGHFPPKKLPKVLWVGVEKNDLLLRLRNKVETALVRAGLPPEGRKFAAHITLARLRDTPLGKIANFMAGNGLYQTRSFEVTEFQLYSSVLTSKGAIHHLEEVYPLKKAI